NLIELIECPGIGGAVSLDPPSEKTPPEPDGKIVPAPVDQVPERFAGRIELPGQAEDPRLKLGGTDPRGTNHSVLSVEQLPIPPGKDPFFLGEATGQGRPGQGREGKELRRGEPRVASELKSFCKSLRGVGIGPQDEHAMDTDSRFVESGDGCTVLLERHVLLEQFEGFLV